MPRANTILASFVNTRAGWKSRLLSGLSPTPLLVEWISHTLFLFLAKPSRSTSPLELASGSSHSPRVPSSVPYVPFVHCVLSVLHPPGCGFRLS